MSPWILIALCLLARSVAAAPAFDLERYRILPITAIRVQIGDVTGDGLKDLVTYASTDYEKTFSVLIYHQLVDGNMAEPLIFPVPGDEPDSVRHIDNPMSGMAIGDLNEDGRDDVIFTRADGLRVLSFRADGSFDWQVHPRDNEWTEWYAPPVVADVDGDGHLDVVSAVSSRDGVSGSLFDERLLFFYGNGHGSLSNVISIPISPEHAVNLLVSDLNDDGLLDVVTTSGGPAAWFGQMSIRYNNGLRGFFPPIAVESPPLGFDDVAVGDFDGNGRKDIAAFNSFAYPGPQLLIYLQDQNERFSSIPIKKADNIQRGETLNSVDINNDGRDDLLSLGFASDQIRYFLQGDGELSNLTMKVFPSGAFPSTFGPESMAFGDVNNDGTMDIAVAGRFSGLWLIRPIITPFAGAGGVAGPPVVTSVVRADEYHGTRARDVRVYVSFSSPTTDGGNPITGYTVHSVPDGAFDVSAQAPAFGAASLSHEIRRLDNEQTYRFYVTAENAAGVGARSEMSESITLMDPPQLGLDASRAIVIEGNGDGAIVPFRITLGYPALTGGVDLDIATADGSATAGSDYVAKSAHIHIPAGESSATFEVTILGDTIVEGTEDFFVHATNVSGAIATASVTTQGQIADDDNDAPLPGLPRLSISSESLVEGDSGTTLASVTVSLAQPVPNDVTFSLKTVDGSAKAGGDYTALPTVNYTLSPGQTQLQVSIEVMGDIEFEGNESFWVKIVRGSEALIINDLGQVVILDDDLSRDPALKPTDRYLWLVPPAANAQQQGFMRLTNREERPGDVTIFGLDAAGRRSAGSIIMTLDARESRQINSLDLEGGNATKKLIGSLGAGVGNWTAIVRSELDMDALAYIRTPDGFLTSIHDRVDGDGLIWWVPVFNPAENRNQVSHLRVVNTNLMPVRLDVLAVDDQGALGDGTVTFTIPGLAAMDIESADLENGNPEKGLSGSIGDGSGKWQLYVSASGRITVQNLLSDPTGHLTNLSLIGDLSETALGEQTLWFVPPASNLQQQGFVRLVNLGRGSDVSIWGIDDTGRRSTGTIQLMLRSGQSMQINSHDLEFGNPSKGLSGSLGSGVGDWRVIVSSESKYLIPMAFIRTADGFLTNMHDIVGTAGTHHVVPIFNPASNLSQRSELRLVNPSASTVNVVISGVDDVGNSAAGGSVSLSLEAGSARVLTSADLEAGNPLIPLVGRLGGGIGKWRLSVDSTAAIVVMTMLRDPNGYLTNLSSVTSSGSGQLDP